MSTAILIFCCTWGLILYTYVFFPLILSLIARFAARADARAFSGSVASPERVSPRVAMIVAAYNEAHNLPAKIANTWQLDYPAERFELLVGSDGSTDGSASVLRSCEDPRLRAFQFVKRRGKISVLNDLLTQTDADIVVMSDANTMYAPDALTRLLRHFQDPQVGCVSGELILEQEGGVSGEGLYWKYENWIKRSESRLGFLIGCNGGIFALRRGLYTPLPVSTIVEDFVLSMRVLEQGYRVVFEPLARATEPACTTSRAEMMRKARIGAGNWQALGLTRGMLHPRQGLRACAFVGHKVLRWSVPLLMLVGMVANTVLWPLMFFRLLLGLQVFGMAVALLAYVSSHGLPKWTRPFSYFYLMNYSLLCGFGRFVFRTQRVTWERQPAPEKSEHVLAVMSPAPSAPTRVVPESSVRSEHHLVERRSVSNPSGQSARVSGSTSGVL